MKKPGGRSQADIELAATVTAAGYPLTGWQIERWRQVGLIPSPAKQWLGRGRGSVSTYSSEGVTQAIEAAKLVRRRRPLEAIVLILFARGYPITLEPLRAAYRKWFGRMELWIAKHSNGETDFDRAESLSPDLMKVARRTKAGRSMVRRIKRHQKSEAGADLPTESPDSIMRSVSTNLALMFLNGSPTSDDAFEEVLIVGGATATATDRTKDIPPISEGTSLDQLKPYIGQMNLGHLLELLDHTSLDDLKSTRDFVKLILSFSPAFAKLVRAATGLRDAFGFGPIADLVATDLNIAEGALVWLPLLPLLQSDGGTQVAALMAAKQGYYQDSAALFASLPSELRASLGDPRRLAQQVAAMPADERENMQARVRDVLAKHPEEAGGVEGSAVN